AGAGQNHPFMTTMRDGIAAAGLTVMTFDYPYIAEGRKRPDAPAKLLNSHAAAFDDLAGRVEHVVVAGKSMGGRIGSHLVTGTVPRGSWDGGPRSAVGLAYLGYPFVAPGKRETRNTQHLAAISAPQLFIQGDRDALGPLDVVKPEVDAIPGARLEVIEGGDHSFKVRKKDGRDQSEVFESLVELMVGFCQSLRTGGGT
ncbi:MAG: hypothetical protein KJO84_03230, partial [Acidimicrobiia bacterium]|nr:hypothetical protein [Acidimicrobiia bacterium]